MTDDELRRLLAGLEGPAEFDDVAEARMRQRARSALAEAAAGSTITDVENAIIELDSISTNGTRWRGARLVLSAAIVVLVAGAAFALAGLRSEPATSTDPVTSTEPVVSTEPEETVEESSSPVPETTLPAIAPDGLLGYDSSATVTFAEAVDADPRFLRDRVGEPQAQESGGFAAELRRRDDSGVTDLRIEYTATTLSVPIEFFDPFGGCRGGSFTIWLDDGVSTTDVVDCAGTAVELTVVAVPAWMPLVGAVELSSGATIDALPITLTISSSGDERVALLWFAEAGLVRLDLPGEPESFIRADINPTTRQENL